MQQTNVHDIRYPESTDNVRLWDWFKNLADDTEAAFVALDIKPVAQMHQTVAQSIPTGTNTPITFTTEIFDVGSGHSTSSNTSRYTCVRAGKHRLGGVVGFADAAGGYRSARWGKNGATIPGSATLTLPLGSGISLHLAAITVIVDLIIGDYVELMAYQTSGSPLLSAAGATELACSMNVEWLAP